MGKKKIVVLLGVALLGAILLAGCAGPRAETGDTVRVHYTGSLQDGTVFDTSLDGEPLEFTLGQGQLIEGFDLAVVGMKVGETKTVTIPAEQAYGPFDPEAIIPVNRTLLEDDLVPEVGMELFAQQPDGQTLFMTIIEVLEDTIIVDANHPLAGEDLTFEITLVEIL